MSKNEASEAKKEKKLSSKSILGKVLCGLLALLMWVYVSYDETPYSTKTFTGIPVNIIGLELLENRNITVLSSDILVTVKLSGSRNTLSKVTRSEIRATADVSNITSVGEQNVDVVISGIPESLNIDDKRIISGKLVTDSLGRKTMDVGIDIIGKMDDAIVEGEKTVTPSQIMVKGPQSLLDGISVWTEAIDVTGINKSENLYNKGIIVKDAAGNPVNTDAIALSAYSASVTINCLGKKEVKLNSPAIVGSVENVNIAVTSIEPKTVIITGPVETVETINALELEDIDAYYVTFSKAIKVPIVLPDKIACDTDRVTVNLSVTSKNPGTTTDSEGQINENHGA